MIPTGGVVEEASAGISDEKQRQIDWTAVWGKRYPVLTTYQETVDVADYAPRLRALLDSLKRHYRYSEQDAMLVLKDILAHVWEDGQPGPGADL